MAVEFEVDAIAAAADRAPARGVAPPRRCRVRAPQHNPRCALIKIAIEELLQRFPRLALDPERPPEFRGWEFRAPRRLDVMLS